MEIQGSVGKNVRENFEEASRIWGHACTKKCGFGARIEANVNPTWLTAAGEQFEDLGR